MNLFRAGKNWWHVGGRAIVYGSISVTAGTITKRHDIGQRCMRAWCQGSLDGLGIQHSIRNGSLLDSATPCVFVANHLSQLDILLIGSYLKQDYRWLAKASLFHIPFIGWHLSVSGHVPVYRGEHKDKNEMLAQRIHDVVVQGESLLFFPEGTRSRDGRLHSFRIGAFRTAVRENLPIVPLVVRGTHELFVPGSKDLAVQAERKCSLTVLPAIHAPSDGDEKSRAAELCERTHAAFVAELTAPSSETQ